MKWKSTWFYLKIKLSMFHTTVTSRKQSHVTICLVSVSKREASTLTILSLSYDSFCNSLNRRQCFYTTNIWKYLWEKGRTTWSRFIAWNLCSDSPDYYISYFLQTLKNFLQIHRLLSGSEIFSFRTNYWIEKW